MDSLGARIKHARAGAKLSQAALGQVFGISREAVSAWESNTNAPTADKLGRIATVTGVSVEWLMKGGEPSQGGLADLMSRPQGWEAAPGDTIPVLGMAEGGADGLIDWNGEVVDRVPRPPFLSGAVKGYAVFVSRDSMSPRYMHGELVYVHPGRPIVAGSFVVVQFKRADDAETPSALVKQFLRKDDKSLVLRQFNPAQDIKIPTKSVLSIHRIVGSGES